MKKNPNIRFKDVKRVSKIKTATKILFATIIIALTVGCYGADFSNVNKSDVATGMTVAALPLFIVAGQFKELEGAELATFKADATPEQLGEYYEALKRVKRIKGFYTHALVYVVINLMFVVINYQNLGEGESYFQWHNFITAFFWGIGLLAHGLSVFLPGMILGSDWEERKMKQFLKEEIEREEAANNYKKQ